MTDSIRPEIATTASALADICERLAQVGSFAFDTEFVGEDNYEPEVCLIQVATGSFCAVIDPLAGIDQAPFWELVADEAIQVTVHAGTEDLLQCWRQVGRPAANVFDAQIGAGLLGLGYPMSLARLVRRTLGIKIHKSQTLTDWRRRPLSQEQIDYAAADVVHLPAMREYMQDRLDVLGRKAWAEEECASACHTATLMAKGEQKLRRLRGAGSMSRRELAIADALLEERDRLAEEYNRPPRSVLRDHLLVEMARRGWTSVQRIQSLRGLHLKAAAVRRLAEVIEKAKQLPEDQWPQLPGEEDSREEEVLLSLMSAVLRDHCLGNDISYSLLTNKQDLRAVVRSYTRPDAPDCPISLKNGWRQVVAGDLLDSLLSGRCAVRIAHEGDSRRLSIE